MFNGFTDETFEFFMAIAFNNNTDFFHANHDWYLRAVREPCLSLAAALSDAIEAIEVEQRVHLGLAGEHGVLEHLGETRAELLLRKSVEKARRDHHSVRRCKNAYLVLQSAEVHARLSSHSGIDRSE